MIWPRIKDGINPSKAASGSRGYGISDRIDIALYEIKCVLEQKKDMPIYNAKLRHSLLKDENMKWFKGMSFPEFCQKFYLEDSFVDENYEIKWLAKPRLGKIDETIMRSYMRKNIELIKERNDVIKRCVSL